MEKKAVKVVLTPEQVWSRRRLLVLLAITLLVAAAVAATAACLLAYYDDRSAAIAADGEEMPTMEAGDSDGADSDGVVVFRLNASDSAGLLPEKIVLRPREWTAEFHTDTMEVLHHFRKNVTLLHVKDDVHTPSAAAQRPAVQQPAHGSAAAAAAGSSLCFVAPADPSDLSPAEMIKTLEDGAPLPKPEKIAYYDLATLTEDKLQDLSIDDQMVGFCGNSSVFTLKHIFDEEAAEWTNVTGPRFRSRRWAGSVLAAIRPHATFPPNNPAHSSDAGTQSLPMCPTADTAAPGATPQNEPPCCQAKPYNCPPQIRYHCYLKLMNGVCDKPPCSGSQCTCPVKSMLVCVRLRGGPWSRKMCCAEDREPCNHRCRLDQDDAWLSVQTTTASFGELVGRRPSLPPPEISVRVYPPSLPRVTLAELRARQLFLLYRTLP